jgi:hypothetical protein
MVNATFSALQVAAEPKATLGISEMLLSTRLTLRTNFGPPDPSSDAKNARTGLLSFVT